ncbi:uncharacterized protein LOC113521646 [Galleria mellonella]|uniref:Uncharacterized protein LOC113521646 n=1 Tax=Galleria mellonella TaxID=7137 RepID=A0A6J1X1M9_GALME|nr:uncharacterized protein LOC113521646 [Galleria mellonella]
MDPHKNSAPTRNIVKSDCDNEKNTNCKSPAIQRTLNDNAENVFTSVSNQIESTLTPSNGPHSKLCNSSSNESGPQSSKSAELSLEYNQNVGAKFQGNKVSNFNTDSPESVSSSKTESLSFSIEAQPCQRHKVCLDKAANCYMTPSTSGTSKDTENSTFKESRKRPSTLKLNRQNFDAEDSSSDTGNDDYSLGSEDGCIYTYRGGQHLADLPSSFFSLDMGLPLDKHLPVPPNYQVQNQAAPAREQGSRASSPDMDFLEMDFDPGPSCEVDTGDESSPDVELNGVNNMPEENEPVIKRISPEYVGGTKPNPPANVSVETFRNEVEFAYNVPSTSCGISSGQGDIGDIPKTTHSNYGPFITHINVRGEQILVRRTMSHWTANVPASLHVSSGDLVSPREILNYEEQPGSSLVYQINQGPTFDSANLSSALYHLTMAQRLMADQTESENKPDVKMDAHKSADAIPGCSTADPRCIEPERSMIWSEREACERQVTQIGTSACGATAVVNVFIALGVPVNLEKINSAVGTRLRANNAPLPRYLLSRAVAGCTAADLVAGIQRASDGLVTARFFPTYPERAMSLSHWLADWISLGAVPILTLNLQVGCDSEIPDAWHHQMVFGVSPQGVYLCNPVECVRETTLWPRLTSPSVLLVRTRDVLARFNDVTDLTPLMAVPDRRFHTYNVLGQVANVIREWRSTGWSEHGTRTHHIRLPASYQAGITVAALTGSEAHRRLVHSPQLPILGPQGDPA